MRPEAMMRVEQWFRSHSRDEGLTERIAPEDIIRSVHDPGTITRIASETRRQTEQHRTVEDRPIGPQSYFCAA
jgi:hypothetical protein